MSALPRRLAMCRTVLPYLSASSGFAPHFNSSCAQQRGETVIARVWHDSANDSVPREACGHCFHLTWRRWFPFVAVLAKSTYTMVSLKNRRNESLTLDLRRRCKKALVKTIRFRSVSKQQTSRKFRTALQQGNYFGKATMLLNHPFLSARLRLGADPFIFRCKNLQTTRSIWLEIWSDWSRQRKTTVASRRLMRTKKHRNEKFPFFPRVFRAWLIGFSSRQRETTRVGRTVSFCHIFTNEKSYKDFWILELWFSVFALIKNKVALTHEFLIWGLWTPKGHCRWFKGLLGFDLIFQKG